MTLSDGLPYRSTVESGRICREGPKRVGATTSATVPQKGRVIWYKSLHTFVNEKTLGVADFYRRVTPLN